MTPVAEETDRAARWDQLIATEGLVGEALAAMFGRLPAEKRGELILDAELELIEKWQAGEIAWPTDPAAWLVNTAGRDAKDLIKTTKRRATDPAGLAGTDYDSGEAAGVETEHEQVIARENARGLYALLSPTQRHIAVLRFTADLEPYAIAKQLNLSRRAVYRHLDAITNRLRTPAAELAGGDFPAAWDKLIRGHVAGTLLPHDRPKAAALLETNTDAQLAAQQLRRAGDQLAALIPPAALLDPGDTTGPLARLADLAAAVRDQVENAAAAVKHQAANLFNRAAETAPAVASTPRAGVGAILATCVLAAGGGTVCAITGTTPADLADIFGSTDKPPAAAKRKPPARKRPLATATATAAPTPRRHPRPASRPTRHATAPAPAPTRPPPPAPAPNQASPSPVPPSVQREFGPRPETAPPRPAPTPTDGPGAFGRP